VKVGKTIKEEFLCLRISNFYPSDLLKDNMKKSGNNRKSRMCWFMGDSESKCDRCKNKNSKLCSECRGWGDFEENKEKV